MQTPIPIPDPAATEGDETDLAGSAAAYLALELAERLASLRRSPAPRPTIDEELAETRLTRWHAQPPFDEEDYWQRRLLADGLTEEELRALLGESAEALAERTRGVLPWLAELERVYSAPPPTEPFPWPDGLPAERKAFLPVAEPLVREAHARLVAAARETLDHFPAAPFAPETAARAFLGHLPDLLDPMLNRTLVVELHIARLEGELTGETSEERFDEFVRGLRRPSRARSVLARYPVLARQLVCRIHQWEAASAELLRHLAADVEEIRRRLVPGRDLSLLTEARGAAGDPHRDGRSVHLLTFDSGLRLVYKPRSLSLERAFQDLLGWINDKGFETPYRLLGMVDRGEHGWMEFVEPAPCTTTAEVRRFYRRMGGYLALLYLLDGTDFHHENLIAAGEHPALVDLETLFQPWVAGRSLGGADRLPGASLHATVLRSDLLPQRWWGSRDQAGVDLSGLAFRPGQLTPGPVLATARRGTDEMLFERRRLEIPVSENRPRLGEQEVELLAQTQEIREGFRRLYDLLAAHRDELLSSPGPLTGFAGTRVRLLFRNTATYGTLLLESFHPHLLGNTLERQRLFDRLWQDVRQRPWLERLIPAETADLARGDVPMFTIRPESRDVSTSAGQRLPDFLGESGLDRVRRRLAGFSTRDRCRQEAVIHDTFEILRLAEERGERPSYRLRESAEPARREELLAAAVRAGERVLERAFLAPEEALWLVLDHRDPGGWELAPTGTDVYMGLPGLAFSLAYLGEVSGEAEFTGVARRALRGMTRLIEEDPSLVEGIGGFSGWGGLVYVLTHVGALWRDNALLDQAESYAAELAPQVAEDDLLDLVAGSAGAAMALLALATVRPSEALLKTAHACGERLLATAERQQAGLGWVMPLAGPRPLGGMSHGAAGIVLALLRLGGATGDERFREAALQGLVYERSLYDPEERNWPDLRAGAEEAAGLDGYTGHRLWAWCHGAPGIGLARLAGLPWLDDDTVREEIRVAVASTLEQGFGNNHTLCHGDLGNLDFLLEAARALEDRELLARVYRLAGGMLESIDEQGWLFGLGGNLETPSLMVGLAGIAYGLARLAEPDRLPSLLTLAPPGSGAAS